MGDLTGVFLDVCVRLSGIVFFRKVTEEKITLDSVLGEIRDFKESTPKISGKQKEKLERLALKLNTDQIKMKSIDSMVR